MFMNLAGLKLVMSATPYDAKGLMKVPFGTIIPVVVFEDQILAASAKGPVPRRYIPSLSVADVKREGRDVTVIAIAKMVPEARRLRKLAGADRGGSGRPQNARAHGQGDAARLSAQDRPRGHRR